VKPLRLLLAFTVAIVFGLLTWNKPFIRFRDFWRLMHDILHADKVTPLWYQNRMEVCSKCPVFFNPLRTCGSPLRWRDRDLGCWCSMEAKAKLTHATCWLRMHETRRTGFGWPDEL